MIFLYIRRTNDPIAFEDSKTATHELENGSLNNLGNNLGSMLESAINCQPEICNGVASNGDETSDLEYEGNSCSEFSANIGVPCDRSDENENSANIDNSNNSDNRVINALNDEFAASLELKDNINFCNNQNTTTTVHTTSNEDCDNLMERDVAKNSEDCKIADELEARLNGDISVETSVETIVDNNFIVNSTVTDNEHKWVLDLFDS